MGAWCKGDRRCSGARAGGGAGGTGAVVSRVPPSRTQKIIVSTFLYHIMAETTGDGSGGGNLVPDWAVPLGGDGGSWAGAVSRWGGVVGGVGGVGGSGGGVTGGGGDAGGDGGDP